MAWVIGRNGIYIEPDIEALAAAYARLLTQSNHRGKIYNLHGAPLTRPSSRLI